MVLPLTGAAAFLGTSEQAALQRAEPVLSRDGGIGGRAVRFVFHDDQTSPQIAVQLANQINAGKPAIVLGSATVAMCNAMAPLYRRGPCCSACRPASTRRPAASRSAPATPPATSPQPCCATSPPGD